MRNSRQLSRAARRLLGLTWVAAQSGCADYPATNVWDPSSAMTVEITSIVPSEVHYFGQPVKINFRTIPEWPAAQARISTRNSQIEPDAAGVYRVASFYEAIDTLQVAFPDVPSRLSKATVNFRQVLMRFNFCATSISVRTRLDFTICSNPTDSAGTEMNYFQLTREPVTIVVRDPSVARITYPYYRNITVTSQSPGTTYIIYQWSSISDSIRVVVTP